MKKLILSLTLLALAGITNALKVLVVYPFPGKSHIILGEGYVRALSEAGHEVTFVTPFKPSQDFKNTRIIDISDVAISFNAAVGAKLNISAIMAGEVDMTLSIAAIDMVTQTNRLVLLNENVQKLFKDPAEKFDVIIAEWMFTALFIGIQPVFNCPFIWSSSTEPHSAVTELVDEALHPAYTADMMSTDMPPFGFYTRAKELLKTFFFNALRYFFLTPGEEKAYNDILVPIIKQRGHEVPPFDVVKYNASLVLGNSHVSLGQPIRLPQNYKSIAGYHIDPNVKPLPQDLKKILDSAANGAIYFSMGSNLKSKDLPDQVKKDLLKLFGKLKQTVIWKFEEPFPNLPKNVHILQWAPQTSILAHPNCKLFITHGGFLSTTEAVHFGVPIIGIPVFADQFINMDRAANKGFAIKIRLSYSLAKDLEKAIDAMFASSKYADRMKELSALYHDRPVPPGREAVYWVEHVARTRGARHLRSAALDVPWYQKAYLDLALVVLAVVTIVVKLIKRLWFSICSKKKVSSKKTN